MSLAPELLVALAGGVDSLRVFGLFHRTRSADLGLRLAAEAIADGTLAVRDVGTVSVLEVLNAGNRPVLFLMGDQLCGGRQNRVVNSSLLVAAHTTAFVPVSCIERRRWQRDASPTFGSHESVSSVSLRSILSGSRASGHQADQSTVWARVDETLASLGVDSQTCDVSAAYAAHGDRVADFVGSVEFFPTATGLAVAIDDKIVSLDVFLDARICAQAWRRIVRGCALDALQSNAHTCTVTAGDVRALLSRGAQADWVEVAPVGIGQERRATVDEWSASLLSLEDELVHASFVRWPMTPARAALA